MFSTCIHCQRNLGTNDAIEAFPIGKRVAFDAARGRLWVVCRQCERWNLSPVEERWEAIEQSERAFRHTRVRVSTDNIGLARLRDGTELVRVGSPLRPEFAAWRYGDQFGRRRRRMLSGTGVLAGVAAGAGLIVSGAVLGGLGIIAVMPVMHLVVMTTVLSAYVAGGESIQLADGERVKIVGTPRIITMDVPERWGIEFGCVVHSTSAPVTPKLKPAWFEGYQNEPPVVERRQLRGNDAVAMLRHAFLSINAAAAPRNVIADGVQLIEEAGGPDHFARWAALKRHDWGMQQTYGDTGDIAHIPVAARLAFEMSLHEDSERRATEGELSELTRAWHEAESIAKISDGLLVPTAVDERMKVLHDQQDDKQRSSR